MEIWCRNAGARVGRGDKRRREDTAALTLRAARRSSVAGQVFLRDHTDFSVLRVSFEGMEKLQAQGVTVQTHFTGSITSYNDGVPYPDILTNASSGTVKAECTQGIWLLFAVPATCAPETYSFTVVIATEQGEMRASFTLRVYAATLPEAGKGCFSHEYFFNAFGQFPYHGEGKAPLREFYSYERYSPAWWNLMKIYAETMAYLHVTSLNLTILEPLRDAGSRRVSQTEWRLDFSRVDEFVSFFLSHGAFNRVTVGAIVRSVTGETIALLDEEGKTVQTSIASPVAEAWAKAYYGGIYEHFKEKGWLPLLHMRLEDEPHTAEWWHWARERCRRYMPGIRCGEPLDTHATSLQLVGACDQYVPRLEVYEEDTKFYRDRQASGDEVWAYSCCYPEEPWYLNKFLDLPHLDSRLMAWACYAHGITGYLHWGFNYWSEDSLYGFAPQTRFKGDGFIIYPDVDHHTICLSARAVETAEGIEEYELMALAAKKYPQEVLSVCRSVARSFCDFTADEAIVERARQTLLELASRVE